MAVRDVILPGQIDRQGNVVWNPLDIRRLRDLLFDLSRSIALKPVEASVETTDATVTTLATLPLEDGKTSQIVADIVARRTGGASGTAGDGAGYRIIGTYRRVSAGAATLIGSVTADHTAESQAGWDATLTVSGNDVLVRVTGATGNNLSWHGVITLQEV